MNVIEKLKLMIPSAQTATIKEVQEAEKDLGFKLPEMLKEVYLNVSNGNQQLPFGIIGIKNGYREEFGDIVEWHKLNISCNNESDLPDWNEKMLAIADLGCCQYICLDCSTEEGYVWEWDGNQYEEESPETIHDCWKSLNLTFLDWIKIETNQR